MRVPILRRDKDGTGSEQTCPGRCRREGCSVAGKKPKVKDYISNQGPIKMVVNVQVLCCRRARYARSERTSPLCP